MKKELSIILITSAELVDYEDVDKSRAQYLLIRILHRSLGAFKKAGYKVVEKLETHYDKPVIIVANRTIISPKGKSTTSINLHCTENHAPVICL